MNKNLKAIIKSERNMSMNTLVLPKISKQKLEQSVGISKIRSISIGNINKIKNKFALFNQQRKQSSTIAEELSKMNILPFSQKKKIKQQQSSSDSRHIYRQLLNDQAEEQKKQIQIKNLNKKRNSQIMQMNEKLVGEQAIKKFYDRYKRIEKVTDKQTYYGLENQITFILSILDIYNIPPKRLQIIKLKGSDAVLDLKKCGLGKGSTGKIVSQLVAKLDHFQEIDLSYNDINQDLVDILIPRLKVVEKVSLAHNKIGKLGCIYLASNFRSIDCNIKVLNLQSNYITQMAASNLIDSLMVYHKLKILNLSKNFLGNAFSLKLRKYLIEDQHLCQLYLHWNQITEKGARFIFEALVKNKALKVFDISWNSLTGNQQTLKYICYFLQKNINLIHLDISFCDLNAEQTQQISRSLEMNHTIFGIHYQGNLGYVDFRGGIIYNIEKKVFEYPMPIKRGILRRIHGINIALNQNEFNLEHNRDICWICQGWQQITFKIKRPDDFTGKYHLFLNSENYEPILMHQNSQNCYQVTRMCPLGEILFYFGQNPIERFLTSNFYNFSQVQLQYPKLLPNKIINRFKQSIFNDKYKTVTKCYPRPQLRFRQNVQDKLDVRRRIRIFQETKNIFQGRQLKDFNDQILSKPLRDQINFYRQCLQFDINNSKLFKIIKNRQDHEDFKSIMIQNYKVFKTAFYYLASNYVNPSNIFSINQYTLQHFITEQKYQSKRVTMPKIMIKSYTCLCNVEEDRIQKSDTYNKIMSRPQFLQFLVRLAQQKWATVLPQKKKEKQKEKQGKKIEEEKDDEQEIQIQQISENNIIKKNIEPMPLIKAIQRIMKTLIKFTDRINPEHFRVKKYLTYECQLVYKGYQYFLQQLFDKYAGSRLIKFQRGSNKFMIIDQFKDMLQAAQIKKTREALNDCQECFLNSKNLQIQDGIKPHSLDFSEFVEALARYSDKINFVPVGKQTEGIWMKQSLKCRIPFFLRFESLIIHLYNKNIDLQNKNTNKIVLHGLFYEQINALIQILKNSDTEPTSSKFLRNNLKINSIDSDIQINLKTLVNYLQQKYRNKVNLRQQEIQILESKSGQIISK